MKHLAIALLSMAALAVMAPAAQRKSTKPLRIYIVDTEGGKADLWVTPSGQTLLIDTGSPGGRDTNRILQIMAAAGVKQIDYLLLTHYHSDHVGGVQDLVKRIPPIKHFLDHGPTVEDGLNGHQPEMVPGFQAAYKKIYSKAQHRVLKPGDRIPIPGLDWQIVSAAGKVIKTALPGGGEPNSACAQARRTVDPRDPENGQSVGSVITFGRFRAIDLGDLTSDKEYDLMCPNNPIGTVDMYFVSNHGLKNAGSPEFVHAIQPRVAILQNGPYKGGSVQAFQTLYSSPRLEDIWQLHWGYAAGIEYNAPGIFIANIGTPATIAKVLTVPPRPPGMRRPPPGGWQAVRKAGAHTPAYWIEVSVQRDGDFTVTNTRNGFSKTYAHLSRQ
ncbi:MAG: ComEC/Rec2 family competence protein [Bryobacteraceae bacterium]